MKLLIDNELSATLDTSVDLDYYEEILNKYHVSYIIENNTLSIAVQKVVLDEVDMNELFSEVFNDFEHTLKYAWLGGAGCDFSLRLEWV